MIKKCLKCGKEYYIKPSKSVFNKYCSKICKDISQIGKEAHNKNKSLNQAFEKNVIKQNGCWDWKKKSQKIMTITFNGKNFTARRASWILHYGEIEDSFVILSSCQNNLCTNPLHLYLQNKNDTLENIFNRHVIKKDNGCWEWNKKGDFDGYGLIYHNKKYIRAHRVSWIIFNKEIPKALCVLHKCDNPPCTNPSHLFLGTIQDNIKDMDNKNRRRKNYTKNK